MNMNTKKHVKNIFQSNLSDKTWGNTSTLLSFQSAREKLQSVQGDPWKLYIYRW